jgi:hypothetical protein
MVRRKSTVRFRNGAPVQRNNSNTSHGLWGPFRGPSSSHIEPRGASVCLCPVSSKKAQSYWTWSDPVICLTESGPRPEPGRPRSAFVIESLVRPCDRGSGLEPWELQVTGPLCVPAAPTSTGTGRTRLREVRLGIDRLDWSQEGSRLHGRHSGVSRLRRLALCRVHGSRQCAQGTRLLARRAAVFTRRVIQLRSVQAHRFAGRPSTSRPNRNVS